MKMKKLCALAEQRHLDVKGEYKMDNVSEIDREKLLAHVLNHHAEISRDPEFLKR